MDPRAVQEWGWDAQIETFDVLFPTPKERILEMIAPRAFTATLKSRRSPATSPPTQSDEQLADLQRVLDRRRRHGAAGVRELRPPGGLRGAGAARHLGQGRDRHRAYGESWRGHQAEVRGRARRGRLPDLFRSERRWVSAMRRCFRTGPMRNKDGVQRGSVMDMPMYPGDPLTPGIAAVPARRACRWHQDAPTITKIPVLPISYGDAQPLLEAITGPRRRRPGAAACRSPTASVPGPRRCT